VTSANDQKALLRFLLGACALVLAWSGWQPLDRFTWWLEVAPALVILPILIATRRRFPLTSLLYVLIAIHAAILMVGGKYTYAHVPLFDWIRDALGHARNNYDKVGHFAQGFVPAIATREILLRCTPLRRGGWLFTLVVAVCLAVSALYELVEWIVAVLSGSGAEAFLGTQGDPWDTQKDLALAFVGAITAQLLLARPHDRQLARWLGYPRMAPEGNPKTAALP
jgi:putative membrane protein